jgi:RNA polymerase sigma factor (sigma-70 family)
MAAWERAFTEVVTHRGDALVRYAYLLCGDAAEAGDLVQDALLRTFARARLGTDLHQVEAYVRRAVLNAYLDDRRRRQRFASIRHLLVRPYAEDAVAESVATHEDVGDALTRLSPRQRACVVLRFYEDLAVADIAEQLNCSEGSVKRHINDAMSRMDKVLRVPENG